MFVRVAGSGDAGVWRPEEGTEEDERDDDVEAEKFGAGEAGGGGGGGAGGLKGGAGGGGTKGGGFGVFGGCSVESSVNPCLMNFFKSSRIVFTSVSSF